MSDFPEDNTRRWRMLPWLLGSVLLMIAALVVQHQWPGSVVAVTLYKAHLMVLGGWGGYWLDRALFPYERPHLARSSSELLAEDAYGVFKLYSSLPALDGKPVPTWSDLPRHQQEGWEAVAMELSDDAGGAWYDSATLRRALIVMGCLVCVGLGA